MSSSSSAVAPMILRGPAAAQVEVACVDADLRTSPYACYGIADARLVDPALARVLDDAVAVATAQARKEGFAHGHAEGLAAARAESRQQVEHERAATQDAERGRAQALRTALATLDEAADGFARRQVAALADVEDELLGLAFQLASALVGHELAVADSPVRDAVRRALAVLPTDVPVHVRVHPSDVATLTELDDEASAGRQVRIEADPAVQPGSCRADSGFSHVDATLSAALDRVRAVLAC